MLDPVSGSTPADPDGTWIFGYGSLIWRPDFPHLERRPAIVEGMARRFWQGSPDHRGVPGAPGRVVTLVEQAGARCVGMAYRVADAERDAVLARLDHREKAGYERFWLPLYDAAGGPPFARGLTFAAAPGNPDWLGPTSVPAMAAEIAEREGPSGTNRAYLQRLAEALDALGAEDPHVVTLWQAVASRGTA